MLAGAAKRVITPDLSRGAVYLAGFQPNRRATEVHDDLYVRVLALQAGGERVDPDQPRCFVLAACDLIGVLHTDVRSIRATAQGQGIDVRGLVVASTHVHSGPDTIGLWGRSRLRSGVSRGYMEYVTLQVVGAIADAVASLRPAHVRAGRTDLTRWLRNARQPHILDTELSALQAADEEGNTVFTLVNLACHPEVMFGQNTAITADYAGALCQEMERQAGGVGVFASADLGGMMTPDVRGEERTFDTVSRMGQDVAQVALSALEMGERLSPAAVHVSRRQVTIPLQNPLFRLAMALGVLPPAGSRRRDRVITEVSLVDLGAARLLTVPGELFPRVGRWLRQTMGSPYRLLIGLGDDELGYLLPSDEFQYPRNPLRPGVHYEEAMSVGRYATPLLMEAWVSLLSGEG